MSRPRLLHVLPGLGPGGAELRLAALINETHREFEHRILALGPDRGAESRLDPSAGVAVLEAPPRGGALAWPLALRRVAREQDPDVLITYNWAATDMLIGALPGARFAAVHNECGFGSDEAVRLIPRRVWTRRLLLRGVFRTVVVSETLVEIARRDFRVDPSRLRFIRTGVRTGRFHPGRDEELRRRLGVSGEEVLFGYIGVFRPEKNLGLLVRAFLGADLRNSRLVMVGDGVSRAETEALARELGAGDRILFPGRAADSAPWYRALDAFAMSSDTEQTSNAELEAMASGLPCVVTDVGDCRALLGDRPDLVVPAGDEAGYRVALERAARDAALRSALGQANRRRAESVYSFSRMVDEYRSVWTEAAEKRIQARKG